MAEIDTTYRTPRHRSGMDPNTRRLAVIACGIGAALLVMVGAWSLTGGKSGGVPVVEADARPLRVKPDTSQQGPDVGSPATPGKQALAPTPEAPKPEALRAQAEKAAAEKLAAEKLAADRQAAEKAAMERAHMERAQAGTATPATPPVASTAQVTAPLMASGRPAGQPVALTAPILPSPPAPQAARPAPAPAQVARPAPGSAPASTPASTSATGASGTQVQLAAVGSESAALSEWSRLEKRMPDILGDRRPAVIRVDRDGKTIWRLRTGGFADPTQARGFCDRVRAKGGTCTVASF